MTKYRGTDDHGKCRSYPGETRLVTQDGRLLWNGPIEPHHVPYFMLDGERLGNITLADAMSRYDAKIRAEVEVPDGLS